MPGGVVNIMVLFFVPDGVQISWYSGGRKNAATCLPLRGKNSPHPVVVSG